ncbi:MAG: hypothetical protein RI897_1902 [Verrucomicrobiota bacterium]
MSRRSRSARSKASPVGGRGLVFVWASAGVVCAGFLLALAFFRGGDSSAGGGALTLAEEVRAIEGKHFELEDEALVFGEYGGSASCRDCHEEAYRQWEGSNHGLAERSVDAVLDRGAFDPGRVFLHGSQETGVDWEGGEGRVRVVGLSGGEEVHVADRVIGHYPLRQFLVSAPGGRWQTLEASYDPVTNEWFNVYGEEDRRPGEWGHWTGRGMNWNNMCAGCHNTRLRKNYEEEEDGYHTSMVEAGVGCESCHGPLKDHNEWQLAYGKSGEKDPTIAKLSRQQILHNCGYCHARRGDLTGDFKPGDGFFDHQDLVIVDRSDTYYADGQVRDEDYEFASFLSSRMYQRGVICLDCHDPHTAKTRLPGNWLCIRCHNGSYPDAPVIEPVSHSHHKVYGFDTNGVAMAFDLEAYDPKRIQETGGECVNCHMPQTVYMGRHWRHDHGFTIPDPLLTKEHGIPNACNRCHQDRTVDWALEAVEGWYSNRMDRVTRTRTRWLARARGMDVAAVEPLVKMVKGEELGYWRAVAVEHLDPWVSRPEVAAVMISAMSDVDPLVRSKAARGLEPLLEMPAGVAARRALEKALEDSVRSVRVSAAWSLRGTVGLDTLATSELMHFLDLNADQPVGQMQKGAWAMSRGDTAGAAGHYAKAVAWDPNSAPIWHDYAVVLAGLGRTGEAIAALEAACRLDSGQAEYRYKLGLALNEAGDLERAIEALEEAVRLDSGHARAGYNLGLALNSAGRVEEGLAALGRAAAADPADPRVPYAMATILANLGRVEEARQAASRAVELAPGWGEAEGLLRALGGG